MTTSTQNPTHAELSKMQDLRREIGKAASGACSCNEAGGPLRQNHAYACRYRALDAAMEFIDEQISRVQSQGKPLDDDSCDRIAAQAMDDVGAAAGVHALHLDPNVTSNNELRRALVRAGAKYAAGANSPQGDMSAVIAAAEKVVAEAIDERRDDAHLCDRNDDDIVVRNCSQEVQELHGALKALRAPNDQPASGAAAVQWRNVRKVVGELAKFCFGGPQERGTVTLGAAYTSLVTALTAKDGLQVTLEPLPAAPASDRGSIETGASHA